MKNIKFLILFVTLFIFGCSDEEIEPITGDSSLKIVNECIYDLKIYFDDSYIGQVKSEEDETWSVPSGQHTIKATCNYADAYKATHIFQAGKTTVIPLEIEMQFNALVLDFIDKK